MVPNKGVKCSRRGRRSIAGRRAVDLARGTWDTFAELALASASTIPTRISFWVTAEPRQNIVLINSVRGLEEGIGRQSVGGNRIVEGSHVADVCPQPTMPDPLDELSQFSAIEYDDEVDSQAARGPRLGRAGNGHQRSFGANHARRPLRDVAAEDIENQIKTSQQ